MTRDQKAVNDIMTAILVHINGYSRKEAEKVAPENKGSEIWYEIQDIIDQLIADTNQW